MAIFAGVHRFLSLCCPYRIRIMCVSQGLNSIDSATLIMSDGDATELAVLVFDFGFGLTQCIFHVIAVPIPCNPIAVNLKLDFVFIHRLSSSYYAYIIHHYVRKSRIIRKKL